MRGEDDVTIRVRSTAHGPILSDVSDFYGDLAADAPTTRPAPAAAGSPTPGPPCRWPGRR